MYTIIEGIFSFIYFFIYYNHIWISLSKDYILCMYMNMYIFIFYNHICISIFKGFI